MIKHLVFLIILATSPALMALEYGGAIENTQWQVSGSVFECRFEQTVPGYGTGVFYHRAGEDIQFRLEAVRNLMAYRSEEHTSELQSRPHLVCRLLLEKKKTI